MSQLQMQTNSGLFKLNVISFRAPVYQQFESGQTKTMMVYFPIKMLQPSLEVNVVFANETQYETFQRAIRNHQQQAAANANLVQLNWPERNILNWSGYIRRIQGGGRRWNVAPQTSFTIDLVDSFASARTESGSMASNWQTIFGLGVPGLSVLQLVASEAQLIQTTWGQSLTGGASAGSGASASGSGLSAATSPTSAPVPPNLLTNPGIVAGTG